MVDRPTSRYDCIRALEEEIYNVFSCTGGRSEWKHSPTTYSPRLTLGDISALENKILKCLNQLRKEVKKNKHIPFVIEVPAESKGRGSSDNDGGWDDEGGY